MRTSQERIEDMHVLSGWVNEILSDIERLRKKTDGMKRVIDALQNEEHDDIEGGVRCPR